MKFSGLWPWHNIENYVPNFVYSSAYFELHYEINFRKKFLFFFGLVLCTFQNEAIIYTLYMIENLYLKIWKHFSHSWIIS